MGTGFTFDFKLEECWLVRRKWCQNTEVTYLQLHISFLAWTLPASLFWDLPFVLLYVLPVRETPWTLDTSAFAPLSRTFREPFAEFAYYIPNLKSHIFAYYHLSRLLRSTFAFAIFREAAFSFRAGTPDQPSYKSKCGGLFSFLKYCSNIFELIWPYTS